MTDYFLTAVFLSIFSSQGLQLASNFGADNGVWLENYYGIFIGMGKLIIPIGMGTPLAL